MRHLTQSFSVLVLISGGVLAGCSVFASEPPSLALHEYFEKVSDQVRLRDEQMWFRCFVSYHFDEPFIVSVMADKDGKATVSLELKTAASGKTSGSASTNLAALAEAGLTTSSEATRASESVLKTSITFLDPGRYPLLYSDLAALFKDFKLTDICTEVPETRWKAYAAQDLGWLPATYSQSTKKVFAVDETTRTAFYALIRKIHDLPIRDKPVEEPKKGDAPKN